MDSKVTATSRGSYLKTVKSGKARTQRLKIYEFLFDHPFSRNRREISLMTGLTINVVTGRVNAMLENFRNGKEYKHGDLIVDYSAVDPVTTRRVEYVTVAPLKPIQKELF